MAEIPAQHAHHEEEGRYIEPLTAGFITGGGIGEIAGGCGALVLSILALAGILPKLLLPIAGLCIGGALVFEGGSLANRYRDLFERFQSRMDLAELGGGLSVEFLGGAAGIVLGLLALLGVYPAVLMPTAAIVFGGTLVIGAGATAEMKSLILPRTEGHEEMRRVAREAVSTAAGLQVLGGLGVVVLGILAVVNVGMRVDLSLVAFLALGSIVLLSGTAIGGKMMAIFRH